MIRVINSIATSLISEFPNSPMYYQKVPTDFERNSFFIQFVAGDVEEMNSTKRMDNMTFQIVYFTELDDNDFVNIDKQFGVIEKIKKPFKKGYIEIENTGGRKAKVTGINVGKREDEFYLDLDLYIVDFEPLTEEQYDIMGTVETTIKKEN